MKVEELLGKHKNKIVNIAILIVACVFSQKIYKSQIDKAGELRSQNEIELKKNNVLKEIGNLKRRVDVYGKMLPRKDLSSIIASVNAISSSQRIKIVSIKPGTEQKTADFIRSPFVLVLNAPGYHAVGKFISKLESYKDIFVIESAKIQAVAKGEKEKELSVSMKVSSLAVVDK